MIRCGRLRDVGKMFIILSLVTVDQHVLSRSTA
ncbi:MAG: hypothetical protein JWM11_4323 [Planctomycetaceae bacterium]|nr:hypothetical protein [Planctomycetaceae bacterium]